MKKKKKKRLSEPLSRLKKHIDTDFEKELQKIDQFRREHNTFMLCFYTVVLHVRRFLKKNLHDNINALAGQSSFFLILSVVPLLMFILALVVMFGGKPDSNMLSQTVADAELADPTGTLDVDTVSRYIYRFIQESYRHVSSGVVIVTVVAALWSAGKGLYIITDGISRIYGLPLRHNWLIRRVFAMGYTVVVLLMIVVCFGLMVLNALFDVYIQNAVDIPLTTAILYASRYIIATIVITLFLTFALKLYLMRKVADKRFVKFRVLLPGMAFTAIAWGVLSWGVTLYNKYFTSSVYGSLGAAFIVMMWIYFMMLLLLYGIQINYIYRENFYRFGLRKKSNKKRKKAAS